MDFDLVAWNNYDVYTTHKYLQLVQWVPQVRVRRLFHFGRDYQLALAGQCILGLPFRPVFRRDQGVLEGQVPEWR